MHVSVGYYCSVLLIVYDLAVLYNSAVRVILS